MRSAVCSLLLAVVVLVPSLASGQQRGAVVVHPPMYVPQGTKLVVEVDGRVVPSATMNGPFAVLPGRKFVSSYLLDAQGKPTGEPDEQRVVVPPGASMHVTIPQPVLGPDSGLIAGGVTVTTLGVIFLIGSGFLFSIGDAAGTDCHDGGFAEGACGADPAPFVGFGVTTLLFGIAGGIGGPVMIAAGAKQQVSWVAPTFNVGPGSASFGWKF